MVVPYCQFCLTLSSDQTTKTLDKYKGMAISPALPVTDLDYADDVDILAESDNRSTAYGRRHCCLDATGLKTSQFKDKINVQL